jgi:hypothetical protein
MSLGNVFSEPFFQPLPTVLWCPLAPVFMIDVGSTKSLVETTSPPSHRTIGHIDRVQGEFNSLKVID